MKIRLAIILAVLVSIAGVLLAVNAGRSEASPSLAKRLPPDWECSTSSSLAPADVRRMQEASRIAWRFVDRNYQPATGLLKAHDSYAYVTIWDIASTLAIYHSGFQLGIIDRDEFNAKVGRALATLQEMSLYRGIAFNKLYDARTGQSVGRNERPTRVGFGWSALDMGRFLLWMKVIEQKYPEHSDAVATILARLQLEELLEGGYLMGEDLEPGGTRARRYQEGRVGYEQYAAEGFALWGHSAVNALDFYANTVAVDVLGVPLLSDSRGDERLTSEPFIMMGLELGWRTDVWCQMAEQMLRAQEARYRETGEITMVSEDAIPVPPYYFYYYSVYNNGRAFPVAPPVGSGGNLDEPRWISVKAAYAWHALLPDSYTLEAVEAVRAAGDESQGWSSGVYEANGRSTGSPNVNTAALVLESALYSVSGKPLIEG